MKIYAIMSHELHTNSKIVKQTLNTKDVDSLVFLIYVFILEFNNNAI